MYIHINIGKRHTCITVHVYSTYMHFTSSAHTHVYTCTCTHLHVHVHVHVQTTSPNTSKHVIMHMFLCRYEHWHHAKHTRMHTQCNEMHFICPTSTGSTQRGLSMMAHRVLRQNCMMQDSFKSVRAVKNQSISEAWED